MKRVAAFVGLLVAGVLVLGAPGALASTTIIEPSGSHFPYQEWVDDAKVPTPDVTLTVVEDALTCNGAGACTRPGDLTIWEAPNPWSPRQTFYHELGHNFDYYVMPEWARVRYMVILGRHGAWRQPESGNYSPNELFAQSYAECAVKPYIPPMATQWLGVGPIFEGMPIGGIRRHNRTCRMLAALDS